MEWVRNVENNLANRIVMANANNAFMENYILLCNLCNDIPATNESIYAELDISSLEQDQHM